MHYMPVVDGKIPMQTYTTALSADVPVQNAGLPSGCPVLVSRVHLVHTPYRNKKVSTHFYHLHILSKNKHYVTHKRT